MVQTGATLVHMRQWPWYPSISPSRFDAGYWGLKINVNDTSGVRTACVDTSKAPVDNTHAVSYGMQRGNFTVGLMHQATPCNEPAPVLTSVLPHTVRRTPSTPTETLFASQPPLLLSDGPLRGEYNDGWATNTLKRCDSFTRVTLA